MKVLPIDTMFTYFVHINIFTNKNIECIHKSNRYCHANISWGLNWDDYLDDRLGFWLLIWENRFFLRCGKGQNLGRSEKMASLIFSIFISFFNQYLNEKNSFFFKARS